MIEKQVIPRPTVERICKIYQALENLEKDEVVAVTSRSLGEILGFSPHSIRKDLNLIGFTGSNGARYQVVRLKEFLGERLGIDRTRKICVVGLGRLGSAILNYPFLRNNGFEIVAGFDSSVNRLETIKTDVKLYPAYQMAEIIRSSGIELAALAVPAAAAQISAERLAEGGVKGIMNFTPATIKLERKDIFVLNIDLLSEFRVLSVLSDTMAGKQDN